MTLTGATGVLRFAHAIRFLYQYICTSRERGLWSSAQLKKKRQNKNTDLRLKGKVATFDQFYAALDPDPGVRGKQFEKFVKTTCLIRKQ